LTKRTAIERSGEKVAYHSTPKKEIHSIDLSTAVDKTFFIDS